MNAKSATPRFLMIDGLRGVAALLVLFFHIGTSEFFHQSPGVLSQLNAWFRAYGFLGVEIFFVISGFVISYSLRQARIDLPYAGRFVVRRSLRLDPPYWVAILLTIVVSFIMTKGLRATTFPIPRLSTVLANLLYLQGILGKKQILIVFWTLCYEIQFYLVYMFLQGAVQRLTRSKKQESFLLQMILLTTGIGSFMAFLANQSAGPWAYNWWFFFAWGALVSQEMQAGVMIMSPLIGAIALGIGLWTRHPEPTTGALTILALFTAYKCNGLCSWLSARPIQYFGRISYSLYLTHAIVLQILTSALLRVRLAPIFGSIPAFLLMVMMPILMAEAFYRAIERPSHRWAMRFGRKERPAAQTLSPAACSDAGINTPSGAYYEHSAL
jgi:peptidoglycan/LPS O-acetylase OafA/YrhL